VRKILFSLLFLNGKQFNILPRGKRTEEEATKDTLMAVSEYNNDRCRFQVESARDAYMRGMMALI